ncbi:hypothetical protein MmiHf6_09800 [Methanimicrococcus hongohii]|uniref:Prenylated flavin chaperone LpdD-like domain-containing protein n=1 Tax=Methanimicrococcus hongohii TaxID=3028295 RepID=A0AA96UZN3_9EURY|nr:hypothetical protein [Methanimicrococcus sp. Hf6]WNY23667.1 hypothetical protein MmiHf6_09800 [Methanimicrococcus sp. Hf6]
MKTSKTIGRLTLVLEEREVGVDLSVTLTGGKAHIGAAALAYVDKETGRTTASVISAPGHKEEEIALYGAKAISKDTKKTVLFAVGIHLDEISLEEIEEIESVCREMIQNCLKNS